MDTVAPETPTGTAGAWVGLLVTCYGALVVVANAGLFVVLDVLKEAAGLLGLQVALETQDEAATYGTATLARAEEMAREHADALGSEALVGLALGAALVVTSFLLQRGSGFGRRAVQVLLVGRIAEAACLAWLVGWSLGPEAQGLLAEVRDLVERAGRAWPPELDGLESDSGAVRGAGIAMACLTGVPAAVLLGITMLRPVRRWCTPPTS